MSFPRTAMVVAGDVAAYYTPGGETVLVDVRNAEAGVVEVRVWGESRSRWVREQYLTPHLTPREQGLVDARRPVCPPTGGVHP